MTRRLITLVISTAMAMVTMIAGAVLVNAPAANAVPLMDNPSAEYRIGCTGAWADIQVNWTGPNQATVRWSLEDTTGAYGLKPVLRIAAQGPDGTVAHVFGTGHAYYILDDGKDSSANGNTGPWNPGAIGQFNHLRVTVQNGTTAQGVDCSVTKNIFNYSRIGFRKAVNKEGAPYMLGAEGPTYFDCSGLVYASYNEVLNFPDWNRMTAQGIYEWALTKNSPARVHVIKVPYSDLKVGDLIFYSTIPNNGRYIDHVAFYAGNGQVFDGHQAGVPIGFHSDWVGSRYGSYAYRISGIANA